MVKSSTLNYFYLLFILYLFISACSQNSVSHYGPATASMESIQYDFIRWWTYHNREIILSTDFYALDETAAEISKGDFLETLAVGNHIPLRMESADSLTYYKLYRLSPSAHGDIRSTIRQAATNSLKYYKMEGTPLADFSFQDIDGARYSLADVRGKALILKAWFIGCKPCVAEIPDLNQLVEKFSTKEDILFISFALDSNEALRTFLQKKPFKYVVVGDQKTYIREAMQVSQYPTHMIVDKEGIIRKVVNSYDELEKALERQALF